jgi:hypothetical protein
MIAGLVINFPQGNTALFKLTVRRAFQIFQVAEQADNH